MHMGRKRKNRLDLPQRVYFRHGAYYFVRPDGTWTPLGRDFRKAMAEWARIAEITGPANTLRDVFDRYEREVLPHKAPSTQQTQLKEMGRLRAVFGQMRPADVTAQDVYAYMDARGAKVRANREKALLSHVFSFAIRWGIVADNPCRHVKRHTERPRDRYVEDAELLAFANAAGDFLAAYLGLKYLIGQRKGDMLRIRLSDLTDEGISVTQGKTGKRLVFTWTPDLRAAVDAVKALPRPIRGLYLFCTRTGQSYTTSGFDSIWQRKMRAALAGNVLAERFHEHDIRAKTATDDPLQAQRRLGHKTRAMTDAYIKVRQIERVEPLKKKQNIGQ